MSDQFLTDLRAEIAAAANRVDATAGGSGGSGPVGQPDEVPHRRPSRFLAMAAAAVLVVVGLAAVFVSRPDPVQADVEVIRVGDELIVRLSDVESRPDEIVAAAKEAGLDVSVSTAPVGPSNVGRFIGSAGSGELPEELRVVEGDPTSSFNGFRIPVDFDGTIRLTLGRAAEPGESWKVASNTTSRGEALSCQDLRDLSLGEVLALLDDEGVDDVEVLIPEAGGPVSGAELDDWASADVLAVSTIGPGSVFVDAGAKPVGGVDLSPPVGC